jgi:heme/copper-type cytochrome/quinol oxidase subunit 2
MNRKVFDKLACTGGALIVVVLLVAGVLLLVGANFANSNVHNQLAEQQITFPSAAEFAHPDGTEITTSMIPTVSQYAGEQLTTGAQAEVYANDFIAVHLREIGGGQTYAQLSAAAMALPKGSAAYTAAESKVQTVFQGTTLRGLLLEAYGFSVMGGIAIWGSTIAFILAGLMALLVVFGIIHARRTDETKELFAPQVHESKVLVTV